MIVQKPQKGKPESLTPWLADSGICRFIQRTEGIREAIEKTLLLYYITFRRRAKLVFIPEPTAAEKEDLAEGIGDISIVYVERSALAVSVWAGQPEQIGVAGPPQSHDDLPAWLKNLPGPAPQELVDQIRRSVEEHRKEQSYDGRALPRDLREG